MARRPARSMLARMSTIETAPNPDPSASSLLMWLGLAMLAVTGLIIVAITLVGLAVGLVLAFGGLIAAVFVVLVYVMRFIGPEDEH
jgi:hypothetical protein